MEIVVFGAGVQGSLYAARLARAGHAVTLIARGRRAEEIRRMGVLIRDAVTGSSDSQNIPVCEVLPESKSAALCFVFVRREQMSPALDALAKARGVGRFVWMVNHACGSGALYARLGRNRVVLGFPGAAGSIQDGIDVYIDIPEQPTVVDVIAPDVAALLRAAGFKTRLVRDMDAWLKRHAVMISALSCAILAKGGSGERVARDRALMRTVILGIREGWRALDRLHIGAAPLALRAIFNWVPIGFAVNYWSRLVGSDRGDVYFAQHVRRSTDEIRALVADLRQMMPEMSGAPHLRELFLSLQASSK